ncbi:MAG: glycoside hydrolase family 16 protein [Nocardioides sp.]
MTALASALVVAGLGAPSSAGSPRSPVTAPVTTAVSAPAAGSQASITVLPPISQVGTGVGSPAAARTVVAVKVTNGQEKRPVVLSRLSGTSWVKVAKTKLNERGLADFSVPNTLGRLPVTYRAEVLKFQGKPATTTDEVDSTGWGAPDFVDEFAGRKLSASWNTRAEKYNPAGLRRCSRGSDKAVRVRRGAVELSVLVDKAKGNRLCTAKRADGSTVGRFKYRLNGHISTAGNASFKYGVAAARMKFQMSKGQHASFWMQPNAMTGAKTAQKGGAEIDIVEWFGHPSRNGGLTSFIYHPTNRGPKKVGDFIENPDQYLASKSDAWWKKYHVLSVEWTRRAYIFRIDGQESWRTTAGISGVEQFPIVSLLSSDYELENLGGENRLPQSISVDWVQFWETDATTG